MVGSPLLVQRQFLSAARVNRGPPPAAAGGLAAASNSVQPAALLECRVAGPAANVNTTNHAVVLALRWALGGATAVLCGRALSPSFLHTADRLHASDCRSLTD